MTRVRAHAPGRVNLIGDHTDYAGGLALPMAIDLGTTIIGTREGDRLRLHSEQFDSDTDLRVPLQDARIQPDWARYIAAVAIEMNCTIGFHGVIDSTLPLGAGLSSSASLELATALALGFEGRPLELAFLGQRSEFTAVGVPCGLLDQLSSAFGRDGHALMIDFASVTVEPIPMPRGLEIIVVHSGVERALAGSAYAERRAACESAISIVGELRSCSTDDLDAITDPVIRRRAHHVVTECQRVTEARSALLGGDGILFGELMNASHRSLRDDFEVSTPVVDALVEHLVAIPGVHGARVTGAGFGGCVVAACEPGAIAEPAAITGRGWRVRASGPARVELLES
jgi:galactokinase